MSFTVTGETSDQQPASVFDAKPMFLLGMMEQDTPEWTYLVGEAALLH